MVFASLEFLFYFLPVALGVYLLTPKRLKNAMLLLGSLAFYTWGGGAFVVILLVSILIDYVLGFLVANGVENDNALRRNLGIALSVLLNVGFLAYFKYAGFVTDQLNGLAGQLGWGTIAWQGVALPIGISFFTFQSMSYTIDVARGRAEHLSNVIDFGLYVSFFPQLIAGPIVRFHEFADQIPDHPVTADRFAIGAARFSHGLAKKVIIADAVAVVADAAFNLPTGELTFISAWLGTLAFTLQIYFDFSGYSDMAIGLALMFGFELPENFNRPYSAVSITDFWRRWHITLSNWFRDYLYVPLGGSKATSFLTYRNLIVVFLLTGLWHGANWTFVVWGAYHGLLLLSERVTKQRPTGDGAVSALVLRRAGVLLAVANGWVLFRSDSLEHAASFLGQMYLNLSFELAPALSAALTHKALLTLVFGSAVFLLPRSFAFGRMLTIRSDQRSDVARVATVLGGLTYSVALLSAGSFSPFLYFQF